MTARNDKEQIIGATYYNTSRYESPAPVIIEVIFQTMNSIQQLWELPKQRYSRLALMSSKQLEEHGDIHC